MRKSESYASNGGEQEKGEWWGRGARDEHAMGKQSKSQACDGEEREIDE